MAGSNPFFSVIEDEDDERFLRGSSRPAYETSSLEERRQQLLAERQKIEERTINSSLRSISLLHESEDIGNTTAEELARQREQLKSTEQKLDDINSSLHISQRHIQGIKSVFGGIKNYFSSKPDLPSPRKPASDEVPSSTAAVSQKKLSEISSSSQSGASPSSNIMPIRSSASGRSATKPSTDDILDENLLIMGDSLARLKGLGMGLQQEIEEQNVLVDRITDKTESVGFRVKQQSQQMDKILKK